MYVWTSREASDDQFAADTIVKQAPFISGMGYKPWCQDVTNRCSLECHVPSIYTAVSMTFLKSWSLLSCVLVA